MITAASGRQVFLTLAVLALAILFLDLTPGCQAVTAAMRRAEAHRAVQEYGAAIDDYRQAASLMPGWPEPWQRQGEILLRQHRFGPAAEAFAQAESRGGGLRAVLARGEAQASRGDWAAAQKTWLRALMLAPRNADVRLALARATLAQRQFDAAEDHAHAALALEPEPAVAAAAHALLGRLMAGPDPAEAAGHFAQAGDADMLAVLKAVSAEADPARRPLLLGIAFMQRGELPLARRELERAVALAPGSAEVHAYLGHVLDLGGETGTARGVLEQARALDPESGLALYFSGSHYHRTGDPLKAVEMLWAGLQHEPDNAALRLEMAAVYVDLHDYAGAAEWYQGALDRAPQAQKLDFQLAVARFHVDHLYRLVEAGIPAAEAAAALAPDNAEVQDLRGWAYYLAGQTQKAQQALATALALDPSLASTHFHLGSLYAALGRRELAASHLNRASDLDTTGYYRERAEQVLAGLN